MQRVMPVAEQAQKLPAARWQFFCPFDL